MNFQSVKLDLEKAEEQEVKLRTSVRSSRSKRNSGKTYISALLIMPKPLTVWVTKNCGKFFQKGNTRLPDLPPEKSVCRSKATEDWTWKKQTDSKSGKEYVKPVYCHPAYLIYRQSTS